MKLLVLVGFAIIAVACAQAPSAEYLPPAEEYSGAASSAVESNFLESEPAHTLADDGYRYKTVRRFRFRHRRDVNELPSNEYLPPHAGAASSAVSVAAAPEPFQAPVEQNYEVAASAPEPAHELADDGYRYKTVKRFRLRHRRRRGAPSNEYLPPHAEAASAPVAVEYAPEPAPEEQHFEVAASAPEPAHELADDGYRYKTVKRLRLRHRRRRRDVNELPSNEYLPPHAGAASSAVSVAAAPEPFQAPVEQHFEVAASAPEPAHELADDGYRYKTVKRFRLRHRRRRGAPSSEYLPPHAEAASAPVPVEYAPEPAPEEQHFEVAASAPEPAHELADDGYRYKTVKRFRLRHRRRRGAPSSEYLPPHAEAASAPVPVEYAPEPAPEEQHFEVAASAPEPAHELADDGYRYKTVKRLRLRHRRRRRDVNELPSNEYLPPHAGAASSAVSVAAAPEPFQAPVEQHFEVAASAPEPAHELADDGYRYKTVKRFRLRHRRRRGAPSSEYLPPHAEAAASAPVAVEYAPEPAPEEQHFEVAASAPEPAHELADDGYRYKTVKRFRLRHRRRRGAPSSKYLPPHAEAAASAPVAVEYAPEPAPEEQHFEVAASAPEPAHELADDGYRYKTVKRFRLRHRRRRDVNELPSNEYLPPHAGAASSAFSVAVAPEPVPAPAPVEQHFEAAASAPEPAHELAADGYRYKTVKRYRYRHRH